jgi:hypothetical protein
MSQTSSESQWLHDVGCTLTEHDDRRSLYYALQDAASGPPRRALPGGVADSGAKVRTVSRETSETMGKRPIAEGLHRARRVCDV